MTRNELMQAIEAASAEQLRLQRAHSEKARELAEIERKQIQNRQNLRELRETLEKMGRQP